jgi:hypothetical protein
MFQFHCNFDFFFFFYKIIFLNSVFTVKFVPFIAFIEIGFLLG